MEYHGWCKIILGVFEKAPEGQNKSYAFPKHYNREQEVQLCQNRPRDVDTGGTPAMKKIDKCDRVDYNYT